jgi:multiple sugar transport system permease protein
VAQTVATGRARPVLGGRRGPGRGHGGLIASERRFGYVMVAPAVIALLAITAFPLVYNIWNSFHHVNLLAPATNGTSAGFSNYSRVFTGADFGPSLARTVVFTVISVFIEIVAGLCIALALDRAFPGRGLVRAAVFIPWAVPTVVSAMLWKTMFDPRQGFINYVLATLHLPGGHATWLANTWTAWTAVFVADAWKNVPFVAILLLAGLQVIPRDIYEAARVDGARPWQAFWRLTLPLLKPALMVALIFRTLSAFLVFDVIYIMTGGGPGNTTEAVAYLNWRAFLVDTDFGYGGAVSVVLIAIALLIAFVYTRALRTD